MNYQGELCRECKKEIQVYSASGFCRKCWHEKRGGKTFPGSKEIKEEQNDGKKMD